MVKPFDECGCDDAHEKSEKKDIKKIKKSADKLDNMHKNVDEARTKAQQDAGAFAQTPAYKLKPPTFGHYPGSENDKALKKASLKSKDDSDTIRKRQDARTHIRWGTPHDQITNRKPGGALGRAQYEKDRQDDAKRPESKPDPGSPEAVIHKHLMKRR
jgi:hypothetical protein